MRVSMSFQTFRILSFPWEKINPRTVFSCHRYLHASTSMLWGILSVAWRLLSWVGLNLGQSEAEHHCKGLKTKSRLKCFDKAKYWYSILTTIDGQNMRECLFSLSLSLSLSLFLSLLQSVGISWSFNVINTLTVT